MSLPNPDMDFSAFDVLTADQLDNLVENIESLADGSGIDENSINLSKIKTASEFVFDFVASGCVWTGDALGSTRAASMTSGVVYIGGKRVTVATVSARTFTASRDTYIDVDNTGTVFYTEVTNNNASPALSAGRIRLGIIVTAAGSIAAVGSINQGEYDKVLPIASSIAYSVTDSLGNLICPRDPYRKLLGYRQITANRTTSDTSATLIPGLTCPVIVPAGRKVIVTAYTPNGSNATAGINVFLSLWDGTVGSGTLIEQAIFTAPLSNANAPMPCISPPVSPAAGLKTYNVGWHNGGVNNGTFSAATTAPGYVKVELV